MVLNEDLHNDILELDVHDGCHCLLLRAEQSRPEDHAQISDGHQVLLVVTGHTVEGVRQRGRERVGIATFNPKPATLQLPRFKLVSLLSSTPSQQQKGDVFQLVN